jgi:hypothetical protein
MNAKKILLISLPIVIVGFIASRFIPNISLSHRVSPETPVEEVPLINPDLAPQAGAILSTDVTSVVIIRNDVRFEGINGLALQAGDRLEVGSPGGAAIIWPHYGRTLLEEGSVVIIRRAFESTNRERFEAKIFLEKGRVWSKFRDVFSQGQAFQMRVGNVLLDASGGSFGVTRESNDDVTIDVRSQAVRAWTIREESPSPQMRAEGFDETYAEVATSKPQEIGGRALIMSQSASTVSADPSTDIFAERGDDDFYPNELDLEPVDATLLR